MLTVRYQRLGLPPGDLLLDLGCGFGRHAYEAAKRGARVVAFDYADNELKEVRNTFGAMAEAGEVARASLAGAVQGDGTRLPFADGTFDRVIASEVLEHIADDAAALGELARVLRPGGTMAVTVPGLAAGAGLLGPVRRVPRTVRGGRPRAHLPRRRAPRPHARCGPRAGLVAPRPRAALARTGGCAAPSGPRTTTITAVAAYRKVLEWDIMKAPTATRWTERALNPVLGKSLVVYARKPGP